ncbi:hypothetical protein QR98_0038140 [Sarcoptes scabiei]|uniref:Uncharacterized protein n=1 Tax=Sarcoptes scabiei TaxID=52283 RepID=A0A132A2V7_SARSC|nr:hypothetical protein QR98_0038140 [Sarcoptes scabiei]
MNIAASNQSTVSSSGPTDLNCSKTSSSTIKIRNLAHLLQQLDEIGGGSSVTESAPSALSTSVGEGTTPESSELYSVGAAVSSHQTATLPSTTSSQQSQLKSNFLDLDFFMGTNLQGFADQTTRVLSSPSSVNLAPNCRTNRSSVLMPLNQFAGNVPPASYFTSLPPISPSTTTSTTTSTTAREDEDLAGPNDHHLHHSHLHHRRNRRCLNTSGDDEDEDDDDDDDGGGGDDVDDDDVDDDENEEHDEAEEYDFEENGSAFDSDLNADLNPQYPGFIHNASNIGQSLSNSQKHQHSNSKQSTMITTNSRQESNDKHIGNAFLNSLTRSASEEALPCSTRRSLPIQLPQRLSQQLLPQLHQVRQKNRKNYHHHQPQPFIQCDQKYENQVAKNRSSIPKRSNCSMQTNYCTLPRQWLEQMARQFHLQQIIQHQQQQQSQQQSVAFEVIRSVSTTTPDPPIP